MLTRFNVITKLLFVVQAFLLFITLGCAPKKGTSESTDYGVLAGRQLSEDEVVAALKAADFPAKVIPEMVCTAWFESGWRAGSYNYNKNGSTDFGLFQINSMNWSYCETTKAALGNPTTNARCAKKIYDMLGLGAWYGYKSHTKTCNAYVLNQTHLGLTGAESTASLLAPGKTENPALEPSEKINGEMFKEWGHGSENQMIEGHSKL